ncbi:transmembrane protein, putative, partial [Bodo saltans]
GSSPGYRDGIGVAAQFLYPYGVVHYLFNVGMVVFVADYQTNRIRRIVVASANVTTVAQTTYSCYYLCISRDGSSLFVGTDYTVVRIKSSTGAIVTLAGSGSYGSTDGIGTRARFYFACGIALNDKETALFVADTNNKLVRRVELSSNNVSTIAGATTMRGLVDGPGLAARFSNPFGGKWYCNKTSLLCGLLVADSGNGAIRFVAVELFYTRTAEQSSEATASVSRSSTMPLSGSLTASQSVIASCTTSITQSLSPTKSKSDSIVTSASITASITTRTPSPSVTMYCALVPADGTSSVGSLQRFNSTALSLVPIVGTVSASTFVSAAPINRAVLLQNLPLGMNLSVSLGGTIRGGPADGWTLISATINVAASDSILPLLTAVVPFTLLSANIVGREQTFVVVLRPPNTTGRWLPSSLNTFRAVSIA